MEKGREKLGDKESVFERLPVKTAVWKQILPAVAIQMIVLVYSLADTYFVGMLNDPNQTAAITVVSPAFIMLNAISNLFGIGGASLIAGYLGKKKRECAGGISGTAFWSGAAAAWGFSLLFLLLEEPVLYLCGAGPDTYKLARGYAKWVILLGGPVTILNNLLANLIRGEGNAGVASIGVSLGGIVNIILDPLFVLPQFWGFGAGGAGMATALSSLCSGLFFLWYILRQKAATVISLRIPKAREIKKYLLEIFPVGAPSAVQYALTVVAVSAQNYFVASYDTAAVAALGIVKKLDQLPLYFSIGVANGLLPLLAYNHAAGNHRRRQAAFRFGCAISCGFSLLCLILYELFAPQLVGFFISDGQTKAYGTVFLRIMVTAMPLMAVCYPMIIQFQAIGRAKEALICSVLRKGVIDIPLLFLMDTLFPLTGCMMVQPIVDSLSLTAAALFYRRIGHSMSAPN